MNATTLEAPAAETTERQCRGCGLVKPLDHFATRRHVTTQRTYRSWRCLSCENARKRRSEQVLADPIGVIGTNRAVDEAPDPTPAVALRVELAHQRTKGRPFTAAWPYAASTVLRPLELMDQVEWRGVFTDTRAEWERAYEGTGRPLVLICPE